MRILVVSDLHGDLRPLHLAIARARPQAILCCGDWGDDAEGVENALTALVGQLPVATTFGNHDPIALLERLRNGDGSPVLIGQGEVREFAGQRVAAIGGIWAKSHRKPWYVTDDDVAGFARLIVAQGPVDILLTHSCPVGLADLTPAGRHGGQRCFLDASRSIAPRLHLCGHLHLAQERRLKDGRSVINVGATSEGSIVVIETHGSRLEARLGQVDPSEAVSRP